MGREIIQPLVELISGCLREPRTTLHSNLACSQFTGKACAGGAGRKLKWEWKLRNHSATLKFRTHIHAAHPQAHIAVLKNAALQVEALCLGAHESEMWRKRVPQAP